MLARATQFNSPNLTPLQSELFNLDLDFSALTSDKLQNYFTKIKTLTEETYNEIANLATYQISFRTAVQPLINLEVFIDKATTICDLMKEVHPDKEVRDKSAELSEEMEKLATASFMREDIYKVMKSYKTGEFYMEKYILDAEDKKYFEDLMESYSREGLDIVDEAVKKEIRQIKDEISELAIQFGQNLNEENTNFEMTGEELRGLPENWLNERRVAENKYKVTLKYPDYHPIMDFASEHATRKKLYDLFYNRCRESNIPILSRLLILRKKLAQLLEYDTYADYVAEERIIETGDNIKKFLLEMNEKFTPLFEKNVIELTQFARCHEKNPHLILEHCDVPYYSRLREEAICNIDLEKIKEYFPVHVVVAGVLKVYENLIGLKFIPAPNTKGWHSDVTHYDVYDFSIEKQKIGEKLGDFYLDLYPREGKYSHAMVTDLLKGCDVSSITQIAGERRLNSFAMVCNFPKNDQASFDDVETFFHEFGHGIHNILSKTKLSAHHSLNVSLDFVEAPSQMLENWCYNADVLKDLSSHIKTHEPLAGAIAERLKEKSKIHAGYVYKRQILLSWFDYVIHTMSTDELEKLDIPAFFQNLKQEMMQLKNHPDMQFPLDQTCLPASFGHLASGYESGYYGYLLSETYSADMYANGFKKNPLSAINGARYRKCILEPGASVDEREMLKNFLGREPNLEAFLEAKGLKPETRKRKFDDIAEGCFSTESIFSRPLKRQKHEECDTSTTFTLNK